MNWIDALQEWVLSVANSPLVYPVLFALVVLDAFLVIVPSETALVALAALAGSTGQPSLWILIPVAAVGAIIGDSLLFAIGARVGIDRWRWQRGPRIGGALARVQRTVLIRPAVLIFTARYIPFARIAVNLSAGATGLPYRRFLPLSAAAGTAWAIYNSTVGLTFGALLRGQPVLAVVISVVVAISLGIVVDLVSQRIAARRARRAGTGDPAPEPPPTG